MPAVKQFAKVAVNVPYLTPLDYLVPEEMLVAPGDRVMVGLGGRHVFGIVVSIHDASRINEKRLRKILRVLKDIPPLRAEWIDLVRFASAYYLRGVGEAAVPAIPSLFRRSAIKRDEKWLLKARAYPCVDGMERVEPIPTLNPDQQEAVDSICRVNGFAPWLLFGVTGSGKTEVYLRLMAEVLARKSDSQVLLLVPEINLTPQLERRVKSRFPGTGVVSLHSKCSERERAQAWLAVHEGRARILIGTRLAIFASFVNLRLLIVDEEHDLSYKSGSGLRHSARDLAVWRARSNQCAVVLGSATPSLESWAQVEAGRYRLLTLTTRAVAHAKLPLIKLIEPNSRGSVGLISPQAQEAMQAELDAARQVIVFLNRRGYAPVLSCPACGWVSACRRCSAFTVYHKKDGMLVCHHCGWRQPVPDACPRCGNVDILPRGTGTERIEEELERLFPGRRILRIDRDTVSAKQEAEEAFNRVHRQEVDILVGTQMIAKGHDFQHIGLVVALNPDAQLLSPSIRAKELLFATLMQVSGRAGRAGGDARVLIQTRYPEDIVFRALKRQSYPLFAEHMLRERKADASVPYVYQAILGASAETLSEAIDFLQDAAAVATGIASGAQDVRIYDPVPMSLVRLMNRERAQLLVESNDRRTLHVFLRRWIEQIGRSNRVDWYLEVDPVDVSA